MKLAIYKTHLNGYNNIDIDDLNAIYDGSCNEIYAPELCNYANSVESLAVLINTAISKLEIGGHLYIGGTDFIELAKNMINLTINPNIFNKIVYSKKNQGVFSLRDVDNILTTLVNVRVCKKTIDGISFNVSLERI